MSEEEFRDCVNQLLDDFTRYDQYVDVVSCWEEFFSNFKPYFSDMSFNRFPSMRPIGGGEPLTPDFSIYFNDEYGIVFEVSRTFPPDEDLFDRELNQIRSYDQNLQFRTAEGTENVPNKHDIVLLVSTTDSQTIEHRLRQFIERGRLELDSNLIPMEYTYLDQDRKSKYQFKRLSKVEDNFRDDALPEDWRLSAKLSMEGGKFESVYSPVDKFYEYKATGVLCNDSPPAVYLSCYMWQHVFSTYIEPGIDHNPQSITPIEVNPAELRDRLSTDFIPDCSVDRNWVNAVLEFLVIAEVAELIENGNYRIKYRNLRDKRRKFKDTVTERTKITDLAHLFSEWHCENQISLDEEEIEEMLTKTPKEKSDSDTNASGQASFADFL